MRIADAIGATGLAALVVFCAACNRAEPPRVHQEEQASTPAPPCIKDVCVQRPARLVCTRSYTHTCDEYTVVYEHHCDCVAWISLPDGGPK